MLVENVLKDLSSSSASQDFVLEVIPDISSAVVTFQSEKGTQLICVCLCYNDSSKKLNWKWGFAFNNHQAFTEMLCLLNIS